MKTLSLWLCYSLLSLQAQVILEETFSNFLRDDTTNMRGFWVLDSIWHADEHGGSTIDQDISNLNNDWTQTGWSDYNDLLDSLILNNPLYNGGQSLRFDGVNAVLNCGTSSSMNFIVGQAYTIAAVIKTPASLVNEYEPIICRENATSPPNVNYDLFIANNAAQNKIDFVTGNTTYHDLLSSSAGAANTWYAIVAIWDGTTTKYLYTNQALTQGDPTAGQKPESRPTDITYIGKIDRSSLYLKGQIAHVFLYKGAFTAQQAKERFFLAADWNSKGGGVVRNNWAFHQGVMNDTVYRALPDNNIGNYTLSFEDSAAGEIIYKVGILSAGGFTEYRNFTTSAGTNNRNLTISKIFYGDSLAFVVPNGTVYFDNVILIANPITYSDRFSVFPKFYDFINNEVLQ